MFLLRRMLKKWEIPKDGKKIILIDLDNTIVDSTTGVIEWAADKGIDVNGNQLDYNVNNWHPGIKLGDAFKEPGFFYNLKPFPGAIDGVREIAKMHNVFICSAPNSHVFHYAAAEKSQWVRENLPGIKLILADDKTLIYGDFLIDDCPHLIEKGINLPFWQQIIYTQPYNMHMSDEYHFSWK